MSTRYPTIVIAICRAISDPKKVRGGVLVRLQNDLFKLRFQAVALKKQKRLVKACLIVLTEEVRAKTERWVKTYNLGEHVEVLSVVGTKTKATDSPLSNAEKSLLEGEKQRQARGNQKSRPDLYGDAKAIQAPKVAKSKVWKVLNERYGNRDLAATKVEGIFIKATFVGLMTTLPGEATSQIKIG